MVKVVCWCSRCNYRPILKLIDRFWFCDEVGCEGVRRALLSKHNWCDYMVETCQDWRLKISTQRVAVWLRRRREETKMKEEYKNKRDEEENLSNWIKEWTKEMKMTLWSTKRSVSISSITWQFRWWHHPNLGTKLIVHFNCFCLIIRVLWGLRGAKNSESDYLIWGLRIFRLVKKGINMFETWFKG